MSSKLEIGKSISQSNLSYSNVDIATIDWHERYNNALSKAAAYGDVSDACVADKPNTFGEASRAVVQGLQAAFKEQPTLQNGDLIELTRMIKTMIHRLIVEELTGATANDMKDKKISPESKAFDAMVSEALPDLGLAERDAASQVFFEKVNACAQDSKILFKKLAKKHLG